MNEQHQYIMKFVHLLSFVVKIILFHFFSFYFSLRSKFIIIVRSLNCLEKRFFSSRNGCDSVTDLVFHWDFFVSEFLERLRGRSILKCNMHAHVQLRKKMGLLNSVHICKREKPIKLIFN